jgi:tetratricopeptide (TPR) repeat protein
MSLSTLTDHTDPFKLWLHRPLVDLGPAPATPTFLVQAVELDYSSMAEDEPRPRIQISISPSFRDALATAVGCPDVAVRRCRDLPPDLRTERWSTLCAYVESWSALPIDRRVMVCWTLVKLGLHEDVLDLVDDIPTADIARGEDMAALAYLKAWARFKKWLDGEADAFTSAEFARVAVNAPPGMARIDAAYEMVRENAKYTGDVAACERWQTIHKEAIAAATDLDEATQALMLSRYHRVGAFIPQFRGDAEAVAADMQLAEHLARSVATGDADRVIAAEEMLYAALESRIKEALWTRDIDLAMSRAAEFIALSPSSARGYMHRADILFQKERWTLCRDDCLEAVRLAPPLADDANFLLAQCYEKLDATDQAIGAYLATLRADPLAISAAERLVDIARRHARPALREWATEYLNHLMSLEPIDPLPAPYRDLPTPQSTS